MDMASADRIRHGFLPDVWQLLLAWAPFGLGVAAVTFVSIAEPHVPHARAQFTIWLSIALSLPAIVAFVRDFARVPLTHLWRLYWTLALAAYLLHLWFSFAVMFDGNVAAVVASQGLATALFNTLVTLLWIADVALAWAGARGRYVAIARAAAFVAFTLAAVLSTLLFARNTISVVLGVMVLMSVALGAYLRLVQQALAGNP